MSNQRAPICVPRLPPPDRWTELAKQAKAIRADNLDEGVDPEKIVTTPGKLALDIGLRWQESGVSLTVGFLDNPSTALRGRILTRMNAWSRTANVSFSETEDDVDIADVRIARTPNDGHWSWLGIDIRNHSGPTMNLDGFSDSTIDAELDRVVCHETGHTLGFPHEHLRAELVASLDRKRTIDYFMRTQGWTEQDVIFQVLTPLEAHSILATPRADPHSIMCYEIPGECTESGAPIVGGTVIDEADFAFAASVYPKP
jgi:hypothetical protein